MTTNIDRSIYSGSTRQSGSAGWSLRRRYRAEAGASPIDKASELAWLGLMVLEGLFLLRFGLKLMAANPENPFAKLVYSATDLFLRPFHGLIATPTADGMILEISTLIAMAVYALAFCVVARALLVVVDKPDVAASALEIEARETQGSSAALAARNPPVWRKEL
jgi:hypothetical protein